MSNKNKYGSKIKALQECIDEAQRFIKKSVKAQERLAKLEESEGWQYQISEYAAAKRAALDLKKQLTEITHKIIN